CYPHCSNSLGKEISTEHNGHTIIFHSIYVVRFGYGSWPRVSVSDVTRSQDACHCQFLLSPFQTEWAIFQSSDRVCPQCEPFLLLVTSQDTPGCTTKGYPDWNNLICPGRSQPGPLTTTCTEHSQPNPLLATRRVRYCCTCSSLLRCAGYLPVVDSVLLSSRRREISGEVTSKKPGKCLDNATTA
ncbi:hypothetical protein BaRGS_00007248, partial [Batillaria attramentaria]